MPILSSEKRRENVDSLNFKNKNNEKTQANFLQQFWHENQFMSREALHYL